MSRLLVSVVLSLAVFSSAVGQGTDGCTLPGVPDFYGRKAIQETLDAFFLEACDHHDQCFEDCLSPLLVGFSPHYHGCNLVFLVELTGFCGLASVLQAVADEGFDPVQFQAACEAVMLAIYVGEESSLGWNAYKRNQCPTCDHINGACCALDPLGPYCPGCLNGNFSEGSLAPDCDGDWDPEDCTCLDPRSPIIVDLQNDGISLTSAAEGVEFDLSANGRRDRMAWTSPLSGDAFLALDRNGNGLIDDGSELFGDVAAQPASESPNGFLALAVFDQIENGGNHDGLITDRDSVFADLRLWLDLNHDGFSQAGEMSPLGAFGIVSIDLAYREARRKDRHGNEFRYRSKVIFDNHKQRFAYDVFLVRN